MKSLSQYFSEFKNKKIIVLGDVMLDSYIFGSVKRVSPEAPVPIVSFENRDERLGGAANVALNLLALGAQPILCSVIGKDQDGERLTQEALKRNVATNGLIVDENRLTTVKTRVIGNNQQLLRVDKEQTDAISEKQEQQLLRSIQHILETEEIAAVIFEDYNKGVLTPKVIENTIALCRSKNIPTTVDPKKDNFLAYKNVTLFKPNFKELKEGLDLSLTFDKGENFENAANTLHNLLSCDMLFVTLSEHGVYMHTTDLSVYVDAHRRAIRDVSGAGDTVIAVATLCLVAGMSPVDIAEVANMAGGLVCEKSGVVSVDVDELKLEIMRLGI